MDNPNKFGEERRAMRRYPVNIDVEWEGTVGRQRGTINDIGSLGCFILCSGEVDDEEIVKIFMPLGDGMKVQFLGEVVNHVFEIGFGVRSQELNRAQKDFIEGIIEPLID